GKILVKVARRLAFDVVLPCFGHRRLHERPQPAGAFMQCSLARILLLLALAVGAGASAWPIHAQSHSRAEIEVLAEYYARYYGVPITLVRRVMGGTNFDPAARNGPYYGLMQILPEVASTMGYSD